MAINILKRLIPHYRIVLITRRNNRDCLASDPDAAKLIPRIRILGFDLPRWARWWKRGARFYVIYAYLWQLCWPLAILSRTTLRRQITLTHVLNFHNDSIPSLAWMLGAPLVWGPINHNELPPRWRQSFWPLRIRIKTRIGFLLRRIAWVTDPFLWMTKYKSQVIFSAGSWVERRLKLTKSSKVVRLSQQGVDAATFISSQSLTNANNCESEKINLVYAGRLDWIKGLDIAIDAMALLPEKYELHIIGKGPCKNKLQQHINRRGLSHRIFISDSVIRDKLATIYGQSHIFLFPSSEAGGLSWVEAMCCGLPVAGLTSESLMTAVSDRLSGVYISKNQSFRVNSIAAYADTIRRCASQNHSRYATRKGALELFSWDSLTGTILKEYEKIQARLCR